MPATISHNLSATTPDNPAYEIRPSHWNDSHFVVINASGSEISGAFSNAGNVTFGLETNGFITASANAAGAGDGFNRLSAGTQIAGTNQTISFANSNGITFGMSNSSVITASHNGLTSQSVQTQNMVSVLGSTGNISFANGNGITFGGNASTVTASHNGLTTARASNDAIGLNTAQSNVTWTVNSNGLSLDARNYAGVGTSATNASITLNSNGLAISVAAGGGGADGYNILAAGTQTATTAGTVKFENSNGITFGMSGSTQITASHNGITQQSTQPVAVSGQNGSFAFSTLSFSNANGISFGTSAGSAITASHNALTTARASNDAVGLNTALTAGPLAWTVNSSGLSLNAGSAAGTTSGFAGNLISGSMTHNTAGLNLSLNHPAWITTARASNDAVGLNTAQTNVTWTVNSSGISFNAAGYAGTATTFNGTNVSGSMTLNSNGLRLDLSAGAGGGVTPVASASNGSFSFTTLGFSNANNVTFGTSAGSIITASVAAPGAAAENNWVNLLGANTAGNTTASGSTIGYSGINLTLSGTNGSVVNISAPATSSLAAAGDISISTNGSTISISRNQERASFYNPFPLHQTTTVALGQGSMMIQPMFGFRGVESLTRFDVFASVSVSTSSNSSHAGALSFYMGVYTLNGSTLSLASSGSQSYQWSNTSNNSLASITAIRRFSIPMTVDVTHGGGDAWIALMTISATTNANWFTATPARVSVATGLVQGLIGEASNITRQLNLGYGLWSTTSTALPASVAISAIRGIGSGALNNGVPFMVIGANRTV